MNTSAPTSSPNPVSTVKGSERCLHELFEAQVLRTPTKVAVTGDGISWTYAELNARANSIASELRGHGIEPDQFVGVCIDREPELVAAILGILKSGAAYVPIDLSYPAERLAFMLVDAGAPILLTQRALAAELPSYAGKIVFVDDIATSDAALEPAATTQEHLAHVIYTSGSTGQPKGCAVTHRSVVRLLEALEGKFQMSESDVWTLFHSTAFDFSVWELWGSLLYGARLVVVPYCISRSPSDFYALLEFENVTILNQTPSAFRQLIQAEELAPKMAQLCLRHIILGGEAVDVRTLIPWYNRHGGDRPKVHNMYGPTETTVFATGMEIDWAHPDAPCSIGAPLPGTTVHLLDESRQPVPEGEAGEIMISGPGVARGYLKRDELTSARFITATDGTRMYASGDLGRWLPNGNLEYLGRIDQQVKLHGFRIELGEIESRLLACEGIREAAVIMREDRPSEQRLCAYLVATTKPAIETLRENLKQYLPSYMVPGAFVFMDRFPINTNGKLDRRAFPPPEADRSASSTANYVTPRTELEQTIARVWAEILHLDRVGATDQFFDLGGTSVLMVQAGLKLQAALNQHVSTMHLFTYPTVQSLASFLAKPSTSVAEAAPNPAVENDSIAIVGMAGRFPGAGNIDEFWDNLVSNRDCVTRFNRDELAPHEAIADPAYVPARGILHKPEYFDAAFFATSPREAEAMDPQQRVFLEEAWHALEHAACDPSRFPGLIGVYAGLSNNSYYGAQVEFNRDLRTALGAETVMIGNEKDYLATRTAYKLNLRGPALNIYTACSTSLVAICQAVQGLQSGQCDLALAGGVTIKFPQERGYVYQEGSMFSKDGLCRSFDASAAGTVFSNGVGVVVLKRTSDAIRDGDTIWAVIKGAAMNNDGSSRVSFTAPNPAGQADVIRRAQRAAQVTPDTIDYIEAHGTATPLGDPIEVAGLTEAFRSHTQEKQFCALGSLKSNIGHLDIASGVAGLIKTALSLKHQLIPATLHFKSPNPALELDSSPFFIASENKPWTAKDHPRRAGLSSFGLGGTNAHVILEEAPASSPSTIAGSHQLLVLSAKSATALESQAQQLAEHLEKHPEINLADVAWTLQTGRQAFGHRLSIVAESVGEAIPQLRAIPSPVEQTQRYVPVAFVFPGQGSQHVNMGRDLYQQAPVFTAHLDECCELLKTSLGLDLRTMLFPEQDAEAAAEVALSETRLTQPALFAVEYSLAQQWMAWGIEPQNMIGHSIGEYVAACLAGVMSLPDALTLVATRARLMWECERGSMLAVRLSASELQALLPAELSIATVNAPSLTVVSGSTPACEAFAALLESKEISVRKLVTSHAFHSQMMEPALEAFREAVRNVPLSPPQRSYVSNLTGKQITTEQATSPDYYVSHLRGTVQFSEGVTTILSQGPCAIIECGPAQALAPLMKQHPSAATATVILSSLPSAKARGVGELHSLATAVGQLWKGGVEISWERLHQHERRLKLPLPGYPFQRQRYCPDFKLPAVWERDSMSNLLIPADGFGTAPITTQTIPEPVAETMPTPATAAPRRERIVAALRTELTRISGIDLKTAPLTSSFFDLGFDSLFLTQSSLNLKKLFGIKLTMRQLSEELGTLETLSIYLDEQLPPEAFAAPVAVSTAVATTTESSPVKQRLANIEREIAALRNAMDEPTAGSARQGWVVKVGSQSAGSHKNITFGPFRPLQTSKDGSLTSQQRSHLDQLITDYVAKFGKSKTYTQKHRAHFADPRAVSGFNHLWKEAVFPIVTKGSKGSRIWDIDGNEFIDITLGFGPAFLGHSPDFVVDAVKKQLDLGFEIGPTHELAGEVAEMLLEFTGMERVGFCNTGSEAVMAALRMSRTVSGRDKVVTFAGDYHGTFDEVLIRPSVVDGELRTIPIAPGIPENIGDNILVLDYGNPESLEIIRREADQIAAVLVESVRSRDPGLQPAAFLHELREITAASGTALIFDEIVTGFRSHPRGAQGWFGIEADIATYGKVVGGGIPIGLVAGKRKYMDALDGGHWQFGDDSGPEVGVTFFAGTFVRHPLALAAAKAVLIFLKEKGPALQEELNDKTEKLVAQLNEAAQEAGVPMHIGRFTSFFYPTFAPALKYTEPFFHHMRLRGIHVWSARPWFLSIAHTEADIAAILQAFKESIRAMQDAGFFPEAGPAVPFIEEPRVEKAPLTAAQLEIFLASKFSPAAEEACHESMALRIVGPVNTTELESAMQLLVQRHDALRATFAEDGSVMTFANAPTITIPFTDLSKETADEPTQSKAFQSLWDKEFAAPFDLHRGPLLRGRLVQTGANEHHFLLTAHHIVCDGWSFGLLATELPWAIETVRHRQPEALPEANQFADYARERKEQSDAGEFHTDRDYWMQRYETIPAPLQLPADFPRPLEASHLTAPATRKLSVDLSAKLRTFCREHRLTPYHVLLGTWEILLHRLSGASDFALGVPVAGQIAAGLPQLCGHAVQFLPVRASVSTDESALAFLERVKADIIDAQEHQNFTLGELLAQKQGLTGDERRHFASTAFSLEPMMGATSTQDLTIEPILGYKRRSFFELTLYAYQDTEDFLLLCAYRKELYNEGSIDRWLQHYATLLDSIVSAPTTSVSKLPMLQAAELDQVLIEFNHHDQPPLPELTVHQLVEAEAARRPDAIALAMGAETMTYAALNAKANQLAHALKSRGVMTGSVVPVFMNRSMELVVTLLGILKAGAAYLPIDPSYPKDRIQYLLEDSRTALVLTEQQYVRELPGSALIVSELMSGRADGNPPSYISNDSPAYVIYTSGSTGIPKGTKVPHRGIVRLVKTANYATLDEHQTLLLASAISFDASTFEIWGALCNGGTLAILPTDHFSLEAMGNALKRHQVTTLWLTAGLFQLMIDERIDDLRGVKQLLTGGDVVSLPHMQKAIATLPTTRFINGYGPTENTTFSACHEIQPNDLERTSLPIGRPIAHSQTYVLDPARQPVPIGVPGELYLGGAGLATGYWHQPELTEKAFVPNPFPQTPGAKLYRTGDMVRWLPNGELEFLGRADGQVKIRGYRIELGEVELQLTKLPKVNQACVVAQGADAGSKRLVAYVVPASGVELETEELRGFLADKLPDYMIPSLFQRLDHMPVTANGKIDYRALPEPSLATRDESTEAVNFTDTEQRLSSLWSEVLGAPEPSPEDDFFAYGGTSLQGLRLFSNIQSEFNVSLPLSSLFRHSMLRKLAALIDEARTTPITETGSPLVCLQPLGDAPPLFCIHGGDGGALFYRKLFDQIGSQRPIYTVESPSLVDHRIPVTQQSIEQTASEYLDLIQEVYCGGPCILAGYSYGGVVAWEMARLMIASGQEPPLVILFDTCNPSADIQERNLLERSSVIWQSNRKSTFTKTLSSLKKRIGSRLREIVGLDSTKAEAVRLLSEGTSSTDLTTRRAQILHVHTMAMESFNPGPYPGTVLLFRTTTIDDKYDLPPDYGWSQLAGRLIIEPITGEHIAIFDEPHGSALAVTFGAALTRLMNYPDLESPFKLSSGPPSGQPS